MKGELVLIEDPDSLGMDFNTCYSVYDFALSINIDDNNTLEKQLKNKAGFDECMAFSREVRTGMNEIDEEEEKVIQYIENNFDNLLDSIEYIRLSTTIENPKEFIMKNPIILSKKIVIGDPLSINDYDIVLRLMDEYKDIEDKIYVSLEGNYGYVSLADCYKTMNAIKEKAESIKQLGLSPMETIMYVYDLVRNRVYKFEDDNESEFKSRDLSEVMFGDKIVCAGYSSMFYTLLYYLGIDSYRVHLCRKQNSIGSGHARNAVYVKDPKYDIDGVYYFDPTWDSKVTEAENSYLYRYNFFAKTKNFFDADKRFDYEDPFLSEYSHDMYEKIEKIISEDDMEALMNYSLTINHMARMVGEERLLDIKVVVPLSSLYGKFDRELFLKKFKKVCDKFNKELPAETMITLLNNVRKLEYYQNPEWYLYSVDDIYRTFLTSKWEFRDKHIDTSAKLIMLLFGEDINQEISPADNFRNYGYESGLFKDIEQVRLTNTLREIRDKKKRSK